MYKWAMAALLIVASIMGIGYSVQSVIDAKEHAAEEIVADDELRFIATNFAFDQEEYTVVAGQPMKLKLKNKQGLHGLAIADLGIEVYEDEVVEYTFTEPGEYVIACNISCGEGHLTMKSKIIVVAADQAQSNEEEKSSGH